MTIRDDIIVIEMDCGCEVDVSMGVAFPNDPKKYIGGKITHFCKNHKLPFNQGAMLWEAFRRYEAIVNWNEPNMKTFGFEVISSEGRRIYEVKEETLEKAKIRLLDLLSEVRIKFLNELKKPE